MILNGGFLRTEKRWIPCNPCSRDSVPLGRQGQVANRHDGSSSRQSAFCYAAIPIAAEDSGQNSISQRFGAYAARKVTQLLLLLTVHLNFLRDNRNFCIERWFNYCPYENDERLVERQLFR